MLKPFSLFYILQFKIELFVEKYESIIPLVLFVTKLLKTEQLLAPYRSIPILLFIAVFLYILLSETEKVIIPMPLFETLQYETVLLASDKPMP